MKAILQFAKFFNEDLYGRSGLIRDIAEFTGIERHTISAMLHNSAKSITFDQIGRLSEYLIHERGVDPAILPGALFGKEQDGFCSMLATRKQIRFCLATRSHPDYPDNKFLMVDDADLQGNLTALASQLDRDSARILDGLAPICASASHAATYEIDSSGNGHEHLTRGTTTALGGGFSPTVGDKGDTKCTFLDPRHVPAPRREEVDGKWRTVTEGKERAFEIYRRFKHRGESTCMFTLGSVKVNGVLEALAGDIFNAAPFRTEDGVSCAAERSSPFYFLYRPYDPAPESLCGGMQLSRQDNSTVPGIYYETENGEWKCCPWEKDAHDAAFVLYAYRPPVDKLHLAIGGFSGLASRFLADNFTRVASQFWEPQYRSTELEVGLFLVAFDIRKANRGRRDGRPVDYKHRVIRIDDEVLRRRLGKPSTPK